MTAVRSILAMGAAAVTVSALPSPLYTASNAISPVESSRGSGTIQRDVADLIPLHQDDRRRLEDEGEPRYQASYFARYQLLADDLCSAPNPIIELYCNGTLRPMSISDGSIQCVRTSVGDWDGMRCSNACGGIGQPSCDSVFLEDGSVGRGQFADIYFSCVGEDPAGVDAYMNYVGGEPGACEDSTDSSTNSRNFHVAQLGVFCYDDSDGAGAYVFDDKDFECGLGNAPAKIEGVYTCLDGTNCEGAACAVPFTDLVVEADHHNFYDCIQNLTALPVPEEPPKSDLIAPAAAGEYSALFQANWKLKLDTSVCGGDFAMKRLSCPNGRISLVETLASDVNCTIISDSLMECNDTTPNFFVNEFSGAIFQCEATDAIPEAMVEYTSAKALCAVDDQYVSHLVQLGVQCEDTVNGVFTSFSDYLFECGDNNTYEVLNGRYTCSAENHFGPAGETPTGEVTDLPVASVYTDFRWSRGAYEICYNFDPPAASQATPAPSPCQGGGVFGLGIGFGGGTSADCAEPPTTPSPTTAETPAPVTPAPIVVMTPAPTETDPPTTAPVAAVVAEAGPPAPPGTPFFVDYQAKIKRIVDDGCDSPEGDSVFVFCDKGSIEIDTDKTSDDIICAPPEDFTGGGEFAVCLFRCSGTACDDLYIDRESFQIGSIWVINDDWAEIFFRCTGDSVDSVDASYLMFGSDDGGETGSCTADAGAGQNLLLAELNVVCPNEDTGALELQNSHAYSECDFGVIPLPVNGNYTCVTGRWCTNRACLVEYEDMEVQAEHHNFQQCIQTDPAGFSVPAPVIEFDDDELVPEAGQYSVQFQAGIEFDYDEDNCEVQNSGVRLTCVDGTIQLINAESGFLCETVSDSVIECAETEFTVRGERVNVAEYECTATDVVPQTRVEYLATEIGCTSSSEETATRYIDLGVLCGDPGDQSFLSSDIFFECAQENGYTIRTADVLFSCFSTIDVPENSDNEQITIPAAQAFTDYRWAFLSTNFCWTLKPPTTASAASRAELRKVAKAAKGGSKGSSSSGSSTSSITSSSSTSGATTSTSGSNPNRIGSGGSSSGLNASSADRASFAAGLVALVAAVAAFA
ncbi:expressed unknown protein [Seminavis robusta]|uniref:Uncharacterized protein n=1 Tax=Seminavis robusta TaxID=568900 RepID=A0A9N8HII3_9STRA|nr:expressed unknown protein [Seminavis robusta]|eukprot:Sro699_g189450.1 n/a (1088) ;mRNA; r:20901-24321